MYTMRASLHADLSHKFSQTDATDITVRRSASSRSMTTSPLRLPDWTILAHRVGKSKGQISAQASSADMPTLIMSSIPGPATQYYRASRHVTWLLALGPALCRLQLDSFLLPVLFLLSFALFSLRPRHIISTPSSLPRLPSGKSTTHHGLSDTRNSQNPLSTSLGRSG